MRDVSIIFRDGHERNFHQAFHTDVNAYMFRVWDSEQVVHCFPLDTVAEFTIKVLDEPL